MPCKVCHTSNVISIGGIDYCAECSTQTEDTRIEVSDGETTFSWRSSVRSRSSSPSSRKGAGEDDLKLYVPWITHEAYNVILWKQVSALIELGASKNLKDAVLYIWALYLQKCEIAFRKDCAAVEELPRLGFVPKRRDVKVLYGNRIAAIKRKSRRKKSTKKKEDSMKESAKETSEPEDSNLEDASTVQNAEVSGNESSVTNDALNVQNAEVSGNESSVTNDASTVQNAEVSGNESSVTNDALTVQNAEVSGNESLVTNADTTDYNTEISGNESSAASESSVRKNSHSKYASYVRNFIKRKGLNALKKSKSDSVVSEMTLSKTLCFCYLGLIYIEDQFTLSDVVRFANEGRIPYFNAADCLPSTMKLQYNDFVFLRTLNNPDLYKLSMMGAKLVQFLDLPSFKHRSLLPLVCRYIKDLNLPNDLIPIVKHLLVKLSENDSERYEKLPRMTARCSPIPVYENKAIAFIIIALKLLFIFDGKFEKEHSDIMMKLNALNKDNKYFVWNEWYQHSAVKEYLFLPERISFSFPRFRRIDCLSAEQIISNYPISELKQLSDDDCTNRKNKRAAKLAIEELLFKVAEITKAKQKMPTAFPLKSEVKHFLSTWESMTAYKDSDGLSFAILSKDFSSSSLDYDISFTNSTEDIKSLLISSLYQSAGDMRVSFSSLSCEAVTTTSKYWIRNYTRRNSNNTTEFFNRLPSTFRWLLRFLSKYIGTEVVELYCEVLKIEKRLLLGRQKFQNIV